MTYYYLIASLPDIPRDKRYEMPIDSEELLSTISRNLSPADHQLFNAILYQNDNRNLLNLLFAEYHNLSNTHFVSPAVLSREELKSFRRNQAILPDYMIEFLQDTSGIAASSSPYELEQKLRRYFMQFIEGLKSSFIKSYYDTQYKLESLLSRINQTVNSPGSETDIQGHNFTGSWRELLPDQVMVTADVSNLIKDRKYTDVEKYVDGLYWDFTSLYSDIFSIEAVLCHVIKIVRLSRWEQASLREASKIEDFKSLVADLRDSDYLTNTIAT